jgi:nucleotide-binding universal stress UspA family protein
MVWTAEISDAARDSGLASDGRDPDGVERTVVCGLDGHAVGGATAFAAGLARRLGWRLSLVLLPVGAAEGVRLRCLLAAARRDRAWLVVTENVAGGRGAAEYVDLSRNAACPLIAVPREAPALGTGPLMCGIDSRGPSGTTARAASRLAQATGARLQLVHVVSHDRSSERTTDGSRGVVWHALNTLELSVPVDLVIEEGEPAQRLGELARREDAVLLAVGAPSEATANHPDGVVATVLRDSPVPVMVVPGDAAVTRAAAAA